MANEAGELTILEGTPQGQCLNGIAARIIAADLDGIGDNVFIRKMPAKTDEMQLPFVIVYPITTQYNAREGAVERPDVLFRFGIAAAAAGNREAAFNADSVRLLDWELAIIGLFAKVARPFAFSGAVATAGYQLLSTDAEAADPYESQLWRNVLDANIMAVACRVRFPRGSA